MSTPRLLVVGISELAFRWFLDILGPPDQSSEGYVQSVEVLHRRVMGP